MSIKTVAGRFYLVCNLCDYTPTEKLTDVEGDYDIIDFDSFEDALAYKKCKDHSWKCKNLGLKDWIDICPKCSGWA